MGDVLVVTGPPGAGKSTVAEHLAGLLDPSALVPGDQFFAFLRTGAVAPWLQEAHRQNVAVLAAAAAATGRLSEHCDVVYDGIVGPWSLEAFRTEAGVDRVHYLVLFPPLDVCLKRVENRRGHGFTDLDAAEHMWREFRNADIDPRHLNTDYQQRPAEKARVVAEQFRAGALLTCTS